MQFESWTGELAPAERDGTPPQSASETAAIRCAAPLVGRPEPRISEGSGASRGEVQAVFRLGLTMRSRTAVTTVPATSAAR